MPTPCPQPCPVMVNDVAADADAPPTRRATSTAAAVLSRRPGMVFRTRGAMRGWRGGASRRALSLAATAVRDEPRRPGGASAHAVLTLAVGREAPARLDRLPPGTVL